MPPRTTTTNNNRQTRRLGSFNRDVELGDRFSERSMLSNNSERAGLGPSKSYGDLAGLPSVKTLPSQPSTATDRKKTYTRKVWGGQQGVW